MIKEIGEVVGKDFYRTDTVNEGFYSRKRGDVADVDPKVRPATITTFVSLPAFELHKPRDPPP